MKEWGKFCKQHNKRPKRFPKDVPTRWNSTYELLNESFDYKDLLCSFISQNVPQIILYPQHWDICSKILNVLRNFNNATYTLSGVYYPTSHLFLNEAVNIIGALQEAEQDILLQEAVSLMKTKWLNYYKIIPELFLVACFFDPRFKLDGVTDYLTLYYECLQLDEVNIPLTITNIMNLIKEIYAEYALIYGGSSSSLPPIAPSSTQNMSYGDRIMMQRGKRPRGTLGSTSELDIYLTTIFEFGDSNIGKDFPVLEWWSRHASTFPILTAIAKQVLAAPVSTVAVEQAFSQGGNILDERRSSLAPESIEAQVCVDDWTRAELCQQKMKVDFNEESLDLTTDSSMTTENNTQDSGGE